MSVVLASAPVGDIENLDDHLGLAERLPSKAQPAAKARLS
jgi:hypothetical protein